MTSRKKFHESSSIWTFFHLSSLYITARLQVSRGCLSTWLSRSESMNVLATSPAHGYARDEQGVLRYEHLETGISDVP
jgi:hypothetical protein